MVQVFVWNIAPTSAEMQLFMAAKFSLNYKDHTRCLKRTTFIGLNWYRLSFIVSFILIGLTVTCRKVVAACCTKNNDVENVGKTVYISKTYGCYFMLF